MISKNKSVDGQNILYHYIQKSILKDEDEFSKELLKHLLVDLSIRIPTNFYHRLPIILPYVVRDNSCRIKKAQGHDEWGSANSKGFLRDDNTLLKGIVRSFPIKSSKISSYNGKKLGTGFVASHIWGKVTTRDGLLISSRDTLCNSFVPNLVWLPVQISKLTDREGSFAQRFLQALSHKIYRQNNLPKELSSVWKILPYPQDPVNISVDLSQINYFDVTEEWLTKRIKGLLLEIDQILSVGTTDVMNGTKVKSSRYLPTLRQLSLEQRQESIEWLSQCKAWLHS